MKHKNTQINLKKITTAIIYITLFTTLVFTLSLFAVVLILLNEVFTKFLAVVLFLWLLTFVLLTVTIDKEKKVNKWQMK